MANTVRLDMLNERELAPARPLGSNTRRRQAARLVQGSNAAVVAVAGGRISFAERCMLKLHLLVCHACTRFERQLEFARKALWRYRS